MPELTIIVPIYNVEAYLPRCLDSILAQTFTDFELVLIDDGSPDRCSEIMEEYAASDPRIVTIHQENKGVSAARNAGLRVAKGTYVGFVDPDDWIDTDMYENILTKMKKTGAELGFCDWRDHLPNGETREHSAGLPEKIDGASFAREVFAIPRSVAGSNCNKVFLRESIRDFFDETLTICEDNKFLCQYCLGVRSACYSQNGKYNINVRVQSATRESPKKVVYGLPVRRELIDIMAPIGESVKQCAEADFLDTALQYLRLTADEKSSEYYQMVKDCFAGYMKKHKAEVMQNREISWKLKIRLLQSFIALYRG